MDRTLLVHKPKNSPPANSQIKTPSFATNPYFILSYVKASKPTLPVQNTPNAPLKPQKWGESGVVVG
jgi:hypothetical protein